MSGVLDRLWHLTLPKQHTGINIFRVNYALYGYIRRFGKLWHFLQLKSCAWHASEVATAAPVLLQRFGLVHKDPPVVSVPIMRTGTSSILPSLLSSFNDPLLELNHMHNCQLQAQNTLWFGDTPWISSRLSRKMVHVQLPWRDLTSSSIRVLSLAEEEEEVDASMWMKC